MNDLDRLNGAQLIATAAKTFAYARARHLVWSGSGVWEPTDAELVEFVVTNEDSLRAATAGGDLVTNGTGGSRSGVAAVQWIVENGVSSIDGVPVIPPSRHIDMWPVFILGVATGAGLDLGDPRLALREYLRRPTRNAHDGRRQLQMQAVIRGWNCFAEGKELRLMRIPIRVTAALPMSVIV